MKLVGVKFYTALLVGARICAALFVGSGIYATLLALQALKFAALFGAAGIKISAPCSHHMLIGMRCADKILKSIAA